MMRKKKESQDVFYGLCGDRIGRNSVGTFGILPERSASGFNLHWKLSGCYQLLAGKCLKDESRKVYVRLVNHNLEGARHAVSMIVGRDTGNLSEAGVTKAAVETVAENTSDGVIAPLIFMLIGGAPLGFFIRLLIQWILW